MQQSPSQQSQSTGASSATGELRSDAQQIGSTAANRLHSEVDARKGTAVSQAQSVSSAIEKAADGLDDGAPAWLKSAFQQGAQQIQRFAESLEQKDSRQILNEVQDFARQRPAAFLAACTAAGFAASRIFKAGASTQTGSQSAQDHQFPQSAALDQGQPWGEGEPAFRGSQSGQGFGDGGQSGSDDLAFQDGGSPRRGEFV